VNVRQRHLRALARPVVLLALTASACGGAVLEVLPPPGVSVASITVTSKSFAAGGTIPIDYTCDGKDTSPQITWSAPPEGTKSLALILDDPDVTGRYSHWLVFNVPPEVTSLAEGGDVAQIGAKLGSNDSPDVRYAGPCPPRGEMHRYVFHVYALDKTLALPEGTRRTALDIAMNGHLIGEGHLNGLAAR
jgi:Raf kinase inhibitor-like YbhB/YbcL family protein